jgi:hypothetical protein
MTSNENIFVKTIWILIFLTAGYIVLTDLCICHSSIKQSTGQELPFMSHFTYHLRDSCWQNVIPTCHLKFRGGLNEVQNRVTQFCVRTASRRNWCSMIQGYQTNKQTNSMVWVRERTIPTERPQLVGEVIANVLRIEGATWSAGRFPTAVFSVF